MTTPLLHLICGSTGAGKTTYAQGLSRQLGGLHFSMDEWMMGLFGPDRPEPFSIDWMMERLGRCEAQILRLALQGAALGIPAVLDLGFQRAQQRARIVGAGAEAGIASRLHHLDVPADERWRRVQARNRERGATFALEVTRPMFDFVEGWWQPPTPEEMAAQDGLRVDPNLPAASP